MRPSAPVAWLAIATVFLLGFRVALNVADSGVIDVGYAGVIGADRIAHGDPIWGATFPADNPFGDTYGPLNYFAYVPFELGAALERRVGRPAGGARGGDLLRPRGGRRPVRPRPPPAPGRRRPALGVVLAFAWAAYPFTDYALQSNSNDSLVAALLVWALVVFAAPRARGALLALAVAAKFAPLALAPLFATGERGRSARAGRRRSRRRGSPARSSRPPSWRCSALMLVCPAIDPGLPPSRSGRSRARSTASLPFSIWGQVDPRLAADGGRRSLAVGLAIAGRLRPAPPSPAQIAALAPRC